MISLCTWDKTVILTTIIVSAVILAIAIASLIALKKSQKRDGYSSFAKFVLSVVICIAMFTSFLFTPLSITVQDGLVQVKQIKGNLNIPVKEIKEIRLCTQSDTKNGRRTFGSGGYFGYLGKFRSAQLGAYQMYATNRSKKFLIKTNESTYVFSCDEPDQIIDYIYALID
ncbi:MAG: PH domain-containing protein [Dysgonamonadaceae bacterium]|jgi:hypothetical protein|nr:PH domain-containing protein [Dysgonamonadaceae bacterium]